MKEIIIFSVIIGVLLVGCSTVFATDYIPYLPHRYHEGISFCIVKPTNSSNSPYIWTSVRAIQDWQIALNNYTNTHNWNIPIRIIDSQESVKIGDVQPDCNAFVYIMDESNKVPGVRAGEYALAGTGCVGDYSPIMFCAIQVFSYLPLNDSENAITHEVGHVLGLGHRTGDDMYSFARAIISNDIMIYKYDKFHHITKDDLDAIIQYYGVGFMYPHPHKTGTQFTATDDQVPNLVCTQMSKTKVNCSTPTIPLINIPLLAMEQ